MVLSEDVMDVNARLLLRKGQQMSQQQIRLLKMWGIFQVPVVTAQDAEQENTQAMDSDQIRAISQEVIQCFSAVDLTHPAIKEILKLSVEHRLTKPCYEESPISTKSEGEPKPGFWQDIQQKLDRVDIKLPEVPSLVFELNEILANPMSSAGDIAQVVHKSPSLAATLLRIVNSSFYGIRSKIDSIPRAVMLIGSNEVSNLALGITIMEVFKDIPKQMLDVASFLEHHLACGLVARLVAVHGHIANTEQLFVSGMLHDIGRLILCKYYPKVMADLMGDARQVRRPLLKSEQALIGTTHLQIGRKLLQKWKLPYTLENNVHYHHNPSASPQPEQAAVVQLADIIVHGLAVGSSGEHMVPAFDTMAWDRIKFPVGALPSVVHQAIQQMETFQGIFNRG